MVWHAANLVQCLVFFWSWVIWKLTLYEQRDCGLSVLSTAARATVDSHLQPPLGLCATPGSVWPD